MKLIPVSLVLMVVTGILLDGCSAPRRVKLVPVTDSETPLEFPGFAIRPPFGGYWYLGSPGKETVAKFGVSFTRSTGNNKHTVFAKSDGKILPVANDNPEALLNRLLSYMKNSENSGRFTRIGSRYRHRKFLGANCAFYDSTVEDRGVPNFKGIVFTMEFKALYCLHPDFPSYLISAEFSQRAPPNVLLLPLEAEREEFLKHLSFTPLGARIRLVPVGHQPQGIAITSGDIWVASFSESTVGRIDRRNNDLVANIPVGKNPVGVAVGAGSIWVANRGDGTVSRISTKTGKVTGTIPVGKRPLHLAFGAGSAWVTNQGSNSVSRINPLSNQVAATIPVGSGPSGIDATENAIWVTNFKAGTVSRIDPATNRVIVKIRVGDGPNFLLTVKDTVWVANQNSRSVSRIDSRTNSVVATIPLVSQPSGLALAGGSLWIANFGGRSLSEIDSETNRVIGKSIPVGHNPLFVASHGNTLWVGSLWRGKKGTVTRVDLR